MTASSAGAVADPVAASTPVAKAATAITAPIRRIVYIPVPFRKHVFTTTVDTNHLDQGQTPVEVFSSSSRDLA